jgi:putative ABC transport system substrate-binding protein
MRRREFIALIGASVTSPFAAMAQEPGRTYHLGLLWAAPPESPVVIAFFDEVRRLGFVVGKNLTVDYRAFGLHPDRMPEYAAELVKSQVDVIGATGNVAIRLAQESTKTIPILAITDDLLGSGLVNSMARPSGNTTGVSILAGDLDGKRQDILIEAVPGLRRMAVLADPNMSTEEKLDALQQAARARNIELSIYRVATGAREEIGAALDSAKASGATALNVLASPILYTNRQLMMDRAAALRLPAIYEWAEMAEEGGFAAYGPSLIGVFRDPLARQLVQLLRGIKVADIPVQQPTKFELVFNLKTANAMGVTVPEGLLARADKVIE